MDSVSLKRTIADNIVKLRQAAGLTQAGLAAKLHYSDKAVSKWERAESTPDIGVLKQIADLFGVKVDFLLQSQPDLASRTEEPGPVSHNRLFITLVSAISVFLVAAMLFVLFTSEWMNLPRAWMVYVYALPTMIVVLLVFNCIWGKKIYTFLLVSALIWSVLLLVFLQYNNPDQWRLFIIGVPAEVIVALSCGIRIGPKKKS